MALDFCIGVLIEFIVFDCYRDYYRQNAGSKGRSESAGVIRATFGVKETNANYLE